MFWHMVISFIYIVAPTQRYYYNWYLRDLLTFTISYGEVTYIVSTFNTTYISTVDVSQSTTIPASTLHRCSLHTPAHYLSIYGTKCTVMSLVVNLMYKV